MASRRSRERANSRPWEAGEQPEEEQTSDWSDGTGDGQDDDEQEQ